jgi:hypothetical protein
VRLLSIYIHTTGKHSEDTHVILFQVLTATDKFCCT